MKNNYLNQISGLSIRARVAFSALCLENSILYKKYNIEDYSIVLSVLWEYTSIQYIDDWQERFVEVIPSVIESANNYEDDDFSMLNRSDFFYLKSLYNKSDQIILDIIEKTFYVGTIDLYGAIESNSPESLSIMSDIIDLLVANNVPLPNLEPLLKFTLGPNGWGEKFERSELFW